jgi:hypothetical protein
LESCFPSLNIAPPRSFAQETPEVGQTLTSTYKHTMQDVCMGTRLHSYNLCPYTYITFIVILSHNKPWWGSYLYYIYMYLCVYILIIIIHG